MIMIYNVFGGTLNLTQSELFSVVLCTVVLYSHKHSDEQFLPVNLGSLV